jgi:hypothetical protein
MHSAIVVVAPPETDAEKMRWQKFTALIETPQKSPALEELGQNVWLADFQQHPGGLARLIAACEHFDFAYRLVQFDGEPPWIRWNPSPR